MKVLLLTMLLVMPFSVFVQAEENPCIDDVKKFCKSVMSDQEARKNCLKDNLKELSPACSTRFKEKMSAQEKTQKKEKKNK